MGKLLEATKIVGTRVPMLLMCLAMFGGCKKSGAPTGQSSMPAPRDDSENSISEISQDDFEKMIAGPISRGDYPPISDSVPWERLIVAPEKYDGKIISLSGFFDHKPNLESDNFLLFKSDEYRKVNELQACVFLKLGSQAGGDVLLDNMEDLAAMSGSYIRVVSLFRASSNFLGGGELGEMVGPFLIEFIRDGVRYSVISEGASWPRE